MAFAEEKELIESAGALVATARFSNGEEACALVLPKWTFASGYINVQYSVLRWNRSDWIDRDSVDWREIKSVSVGPIDEANPIHAALLCGEILYRNDDRYACPVAGPHERLGPC